ncbi:MAG TPA: hypothetical protein PKE04_05990, partial [Clostridia bacterium]|nr:hypothetical protein [Clostridia bacterium]
QYRDTDAAGWQAEMEAYAYLRYHAARAIGVSQAGRDVLTLALSVGSLGGRIVRANIVAAIDTETIARAFEPTNFLREG